MVSKEEKVAIDERLLNDYKRKLSVVRCQLNMCPSKETKIDKKQEKNAKKKKIWIEDMSEVRFRAGVEAQALENLKRQQERKKWTLSDMFLENETETNTLGWKCYEGLDGKLIKSKVPKTSEIRKSRIPNLLFDKTKCIC